MLFHWVVGVGVSAGFAIIYDTTLWKYELWMDVHWPEGWVSLSILSGSSWILRLKFNKVQSLALFYHCIFIGRQTYKCKALAIMKCIKRFQMLTLSMVLWKFFYIGTVSSSKMKLHLLKRDYKIYIRSYIKCWFHQAKCKCSRWQI